jgi:hypothetical protein
LRTAPAITAQPPDALQTAAEVVGAGVLSQSSLAVPPLSSNPDATAKIYLDFDGHFESTWGTYSGISTPVFSLDSDLTSFSTSEIAAINQIWARVSEDYAPFDIDVTTIEPASFADKMGLRVSIGGNGSWYGSAGGVAYVGSFTNYIVNTVYIFPQQLANSAKYIAEASSHESGHAFGLRHQSRYDANGTKTEEYHTGDGDWAPIMGTSYYKTRTTWHNGTSTIAATIYQDDMAVISNTTNGFGYRADDHGSASKPTPLVFSGNTATASGIIEKMDDQDAFSFSTTGGSVTITQNVAAIGANLDSTLELRTATGTIIASANPSTSYGATITASLAAGDYTIVTASAGQYGSVGQYTVTVNASTAPANQVPQAADATFSIAENAAVGTPVGTVTATDADSPAQTLAYTITAGNNAGVFAINSASGEITVANNSALDYEATSKYTLTVEVTDNGTPNLSDTATITVNVTDVNETPLLADATFSVAENAAVGTPVGTLTAADPDRPAQTLSYAITAGNPSGVFAIDSASGEITVADNATLDYKATSQYVLTVQVTDNGTPNLSDTGTVTINVTNINQAPVLADATFSLPEDAAIGTPVGTLAATDPDRPAQTLTYAITAGNGAGVFAINSASGQITVASNSTLDYETISQYVLTVQVADDGTPSLSDTATVTINLADVNEAPVLADATFSLPENAAVGTPVGTLTATDPDRPAQTLRYAITAGNPSGVFAINSASGEITVADNSTLDYKATGQYVLTVQVSDNGAPSLSDTAAVTVDVAPMNRPPQIVTVGEHWAVKGEQLSFVVSAFDPDVPQQTLRYSLEPGAPAGAAIDPVTGLFSWTPDSSAEARSYTVDICVTDNGTPPLADVVKMAINVAEPLGAADSRSLLDVPAAESHWYALSTVREGFLTAEAAYAGTGSVSMAIYDDQGQPLASSTGSAGLARIDIPAAAGEAFYVKVATTASAVDLSLANLVSQAGGTLAVFGTGADDAFTFDASGRRISINGLVYQFTAAEATNVTFDGGPGNNAATLKGTADSETAKLYPGRADLQGAGYEVHVVNTASITFDGNGGADQAYLNDSDGDDTFVARLGDCMLSGVSSAGIGYSSRALNVARVNALGKAGGRDVAEFHEFAGSTFVRRGSFANLSGNGVFYEGKFFEETLLVTLAAPDDPGGSGGKTKTPPGKSQTLTAAEIALIDQAIVEGAPGAAKALDRDGEAACPPGLLRMATARVFAELGRSA